MSLENKVTIVTGGAKGIGFAIASRFAREGARVVVADIDEDSGSRAVEEIGALGAVRFVRCDVGDKDDVDNLVAATVQTWGSIDVLANNAGIVHGADFLDIEEGDFDRVIRVNLKGAFLCTRAVVRHMAQQRAGRIVNVASVVGVVGNAGQANYVASKAGLIGLTKTVAREFAARGITVNAVAPGFVLTELTEGLADEWKQRIVEQTPLGRFGTADEIANAVAFLASDEASYISGQVLAVDGGMAMM